jgi:hypothetical protein
MFVREIEYRTLDGEKTKGKFWFSINEAELARLELGQYNGLSGLIERLIATQDNEKALDMFQQIILMSYGIRDGDSFIKTPDMTTRFQGHPAFSALYIEYFTKEGALAEFIKGALPQNFDEDTAEVVKPTSVIPPPPMPAPTVEAGKQIAQDAGMV